MPFTLRTETQPTTQKILELEQIVIVDNTGPAIPVGAAPRLACIVGEFLKGPYTPTQVTSQGQIQAIFGSLSSILSQSTIGPAGTQDGSGAYFDGNGYLELLNKTFAGLVIQRVNCEAATAASPADSTKATIAVTVAVGSADITSGATNKNITVPAGSRFGDNTDPSAATLVVALSQDYVISKGTTTAGTLTINSPVFFVKGITAGIAAVTSVIDYRLSTTPYPGTASYSSSVTNAGSLFAPGAGATLQAKIEVCYVGDTNNPSAIGKTLSTSQPAVNITDIWAARNTHGIREALGQNANLASTMARGRRACVSGHPAASSSATDALAAITDVENILLTPSDNYPTRDRVSVNFPYVQVFSTDLGSRNVLVSPAGFKASLFNTLPEEFESGVRDDAGIIQIIQAFEPAFEANPLQRGDYVALKAAGVSALVHDPVNGWQFQSSVMNVNPVAFPTRTKDNRRRYADFWEDTIEGIAGPFLKKPGTIDRVDSLVGEIDAFGLTQTSPNNLAQQRCDSFSIDPKSGNTPDLIALGIRTIIVNVKMLGDLDDIVFIANIGPTVDTAIQQSP